MNNSGEQFIHSRDSTLHISWPVKHEQERRKRADLETSQKPAEKLKAWFEVLEKTHLEHNDNPKVMKRIKEYYHKKYVIKEEDVPEAAFFLEQRISREQGHGTIKITEEYKEQKTKEIIGGQEKSLDKWIDYLSSNDAEYPTWAKYLAFKSIIKMGKFEKEEVDGGERGRFGKRTKDTVAQFPVLNPRALALTVDSLIAKLEHKQKTKKDRKKEPIENFSKKLTSDDFKKLLSTEDFSKIYTQFLIELPEYSIEGLKETSGEWKKYDQGSDPEPLVESLDGYPLEWCTAGIDTARSQLKGGDFYVYYSENKDGQAVIPRLAIRMNGQNEIGEVRGIAPDQNLDPYISDVLEEKMSDFGDEGRAYEKKNTDMKRLTKIDKKYQTGEELNQEDLRFLYEIDDKIQGFGYEKDPRVEEILKDRNMVDDLSFAIGCSRDKIRFSSKNEISFPEEDWLKPEKDIQFNRGNIDLRSTKNIKGVRFPKIMKGDITLFCPASVEDVEFPKKMEGDINLNVSGFLRGIKFPEEMNGNIWGLHLRSENEIELPKVMKGGIIKIFALEDGEIKKLKEKYPKLTITY